MEREDIIRMAREAQMPFYWRTGEITYLDKLERFAQLVADKKVEGMVMMTPEEFKSVWDKAKAEEREACEALYEHEDVQAPVGNSAWGEAYQDGWIAGAQTYRDAIRARGRH